MSTSKPQTETQPGRELEPLVTVGRVVGWIEDVQEAYQREEDQAILQRNMDRAITALAGKEACTRLKNSIEMRYGMDCNLLRVTAGKAKG